MPKHPRNTENEKPQEPLGKKPKVGHWTTGLLKSMEDPNLIVKSDNLVTVIKDAYPKAEFHYLILPKQNISSLKAVKKEHLDLLRHMNKVAEGLVSEEKYVNKEFKMGYHAEPSMARLHMHVISTDMNSPCLKTKKHWNSFVTEFFLNSEDVLKSLENNDKVILPSSDVCKKYMDSPLKCIKCGYLPKNIPDLKKHLLTHA